MKLNLHIDKKIPTNVRNRLYTASVAGKGIPCLAIGLGTLMQRTLSPRFKESFEVYSTDLYWEKKHALKYPNTLSMDQIIDDILQVNSCLQLSRPVLLAHSAFGVAALAFAQRYPAALRGIILIGSAPAYDDSAIKHNNTHFENQAEPERKKIDAERREQFAKENLSQIDFKDRFLREYCWRDAPRYWHDPSFDCTELWRDVGMDEVFSHYLFHIVPEINLRGIIPKVECPVFLAAGKSDYDSCPLHLWRRIDHLPSKMIINCFEKSGHYPNYEEQSLFDERIEAWIKASFTFPVKASASCDTSSATLCSSEKAEEAIPQSQQI